jgi:hypothetical protein
VWCMLLWFGLCGFVGVVVSAFLCVSIVVMRVGVVFDAAVLARLGVTWLSGGLSVGSLFIGFFRFLLPLCWLSLSCFGFGVVFFLICVAVVIRVCLSLCLVWGCVSGGGCICVWGGVEWGACARGGGRACRGGCLCGRGCMRVRGGVGCGARVCRGECACGARGVWCVVHALCACARMSMCVWRGGV